jgi:hypothetical protein
VEPGTRRKKNPPDIDQLSYMVVGMLFLLLPFFGLWLSEAFTFHRDTTNATTYRSYTVRQPAVFLRRKNSATIKSDNTYFPLTAPKIIDTAWFV